MRSSHLVCLFFLVFVVLVSALPAGRGNGKNDNGGGGGEGRGKGGGGRKKKHDHAHAFANLKKLGRGQIGKMSKEEWTANADLFCEMFSKNKLCRSGRRPNDEEMGEVTKAIEKRQKRRRVPKLTRKDWLAEVPSVLREKIRGQRRSKFGEADEDAKEQFKRNCRGGKIKCNEQPEEAVKRRHQLKDYMLKVEKEKSDVGTDEDAEDNVEILMDRTLRIKRALLEKANLTAEVDPIDDGILESDMLLTEEQADILLNDLDKGDTEGDEDLSEDEVEEGEPGQPSLPSRLKRSSIFMEAHFAQKWDISKPIPYVIDSSLATWDVTDVRDALAEIERNSCIRFQLMTAAPSSYHIRYVKIDNPTFCGLSSIGRISPVNIVYLSFQCGKAKGVAIHETMHALGVAHQHLRMDRDTHIKVDWSNINPQYYDQFTVSDATIFTSYGIGYAYDSIMHYNSYTSAIDIRKPTMIPLVNSATNLALLGQRDRMTAQDILLLKKMYCKPSSCVDSNVYCGAWALQGTCTLAGNSQWMSANCRKSCNIC